MKKYYLHNGTEQQGPFNLEELKTRNLNEDTPVWCEDMSDWSVAGQIEELKGHIQRKPPLFIPKNSESRSEKVNNAYLHPSRKKTGSARWLWRLGTFAVIVIIVAYFISQKMEEREKERFLTYPEFYVNVHHNGFNYNKLFGGISNLKFTVVNNSKFFIDNARIIVTYIYQKKWRDL